MVGTQLLISRSVLRHFFVIFLRTYGRPRNLSIELRFLLISKCFWGVNASKNVRRKKPQQNDRRKTPQKMLGGRSLRKCSEKKASENGTRRKMSQTTLGGKSLRLCLEENASENVRSTHLYLVQNNPVA